MAKLQIGKSVHRIFMKGCAPDIRHTAEQPVRQRNRTNKHQHKPEMKKKAFYCNALQGNSSYNICINSDMTVSCNCQDYDGSGQIGDLNTDSFEKIFFGATAQSFRKKLSEGSFPVSVCPNCSELREIGAEKKPNHYLENFHIPDKGIMVENTVVCNLKCLCCKRDEILKTRKKTRMSLRDMERVSKIVRENRIFTVNFFSLGEPFLSKHVLEEVSILKGDNPFLHIVTSTNGINLNNEKKIEAALMMSHIYFSIDGASQESVAKYQIGADFEHSYHNMKNLVEKRDKAGLFMPFIEWKYVVFPWNDSIEEIEKAIALAKEAKIDIISFCPGGGPPSFISQRYLHDAYFKQLGMRSWKGREVKLNKDSKEMVLNTLKCMGLENCDTYLDDISKGSVSLNDVCVKTIENAQPISDEDFAMRSYRMMLGGTWMKRWQSTMQRGFHPGKRHVSS